mmetsp:Transcript_19636/g.58219  ORF Transcript_19636/g.58219 Transcript_19636/m.58219 type:complete len:239 (+) Transcript_19636:430-1146(+)
MGAGSALTAASRCLLQCISSFVPWHLCRFPPTPSLPAQRRVTVCAPSASLARCMRVVAESWALRASWTAAWTSGWPTPLSTPTPASSAGTLARSVADSNSWSLNSWATSLAARSGTQASPWPWRTSTSPSPRASGTPLWAPSTRSLRSSTCPRPTWRTCRLCCSQCATTASPRAPPPTLTPPERPRRAAPSGLAPPLCTNGSVVSTRSLSSWTASLTRCSPIHAWPSPWTGNGVMRPR